MKEERRYRWLKHPVENKAGSIYGRLIVISFHRYVKINNKREAWWLCKCICGNTKTVSNSNLVSGSVSSCGCLIQDNITKSNILRTRKKSGLYSLYNTYRRVARDKKRKFNLSVEQLEEICSKDCKYCGSKPSQIKRSTGKYSGEDFIYNGIDRLDNAIGYIKENCAPCCNICNTAKSNMGLQDFLNMIERIYKNRINED